MGETNRNIPIHVVLSSSLPEVKESAFKRQDVDRRPGTGTVSGGDRLLVCLESFFPGHGGVVAIKKGRNPK